MENTLGLKLIRHTNEKPSAGLFFGPFLMFWCDCSLEHRNDDNEDGGGDDIDDDISPVQWSL